MHSGILTIGFESDVYQLNLWNNATQYEILVCFIWLMKIVLLTGIWNQKREVKLFDTPPFRTIIWPMTSSLSLKYKQMTSFLVAASIICHHWFELPSLIIMTLMIIRMSSDQLLFSLSLRLSLEFAPDFSGNFSSNSNITISDIAKQKTTT